MHTGARGAKLVLLAVGDAAMAYLALSIALAFRYGGSGLEAQWQAHVGPFTAVFALWIVIFYVVGLYDVDALRSRIAFGARAAEGLAAAALVSVAAFYAVRGFGIAPKTNLALAMAIYAALLAAWRLFSMRLFSSERFRLRALFVGGGAEAASLCAVLNANPHLGYGCRIADGSADFPEADVIVVARNLQDRPELTAGLYREVFRGTSVVDLATFHERIRHSVPESALDERWIVDNLDGRESAAYRHGKRLFDVLCAAPLAAVTLALSPLIAAAIWLEDRGPVLYRQARVGKGGRPFTILKFRTMRTDAEKDGPAFAGENDPRVTRVGRFLRATRLDELPQAWNILRGEMSFVGPRPERPEAEAELAKSIPVFPARHLVRPGLTGWAQVNAPYAATREDHVVKLRHDLYYLKYRSLALDAAIVLKTAYSVLKRKGR